MAEMLIRVIDKIGDDIYHSARLTKRGDVITAAPDGWPWSKEELSAPFWRVVKLPHVSLEQAQTFLAPELDIDPRNPSKVLQRRAFRFDLESADIPGDVKTWLADDARTEPVLTVTAEKLSAEQVMTSVKVAKAALTDFAVIGDEPNVIG